MANQQYVELKEEGMQRNDWFSHRNKPGKAVAGETPPSF